MFGSKLEFKGAVVGMLLGDASLPSGRKTTYLTMAHKAADREYVEYKAKMLRYLTEVKVNDGVSKLSGKEFANVSARTLSHPFYSKLYDHMYYDGRKTVDEHVMKCLTPLGLALWYFDDGTLAGEQGWRNPFICSHSFNKVENELMCRMVHKQFGITFRTIKKNVRDKTYYWMRLRRKDRDKFLELITPYAPKCMERKINPEFYESDSKYHQTESRECDQCGETFEVGTQSITKLCGKCRTDITREGQRAFFEEKAKDRESVCVVCGETFTRKPGKETVHCSRSCAGKTHSNFWKNSRSDQVSA